MHLLFLVPTVFFSRLGSVKKTLICVVFVYFTGHSHLGCSQDYGVFRTIDSLCLLNQYAPALKLHNKFARTGRVFAYNKACLLAQLNQSDSAAFYLNKYISSKGNHLTVWFDNSFDNLRKNFSLWNPIDSVLTKEFESVRGSDYELSKLFFAYGVSDQLIRGAYFRCAEIFGDSAELTKKCRRDMDSLEIASAIFLVDGMAKCKKWPGITLLGQKGNHYAILLFQHIADSTRRKYYPIIEEAFKKGEIEAKEYAMVTDRVRQEKGLPQLYGTQYVMNKDKQLVLSGSPNIRIINRNRKRIGLEKLSSH